MSGYYLLKNGEFAYNKSYSVGYDFGSIKRLDRYPMGALSTLYICFALKRHESDFIKAYFDSLKWYREIYMISAEGARNHGLLNVPTEEFFDTKHYLPENTDEQRKIADFLIALEHRIETQQSLVDNLKKHQQNRPTHLRQEKGRVLSAHRTTEDQNISSYHSRSVAAHEHYQEVLHRKPQPLLLDRENKADRASHIQAVLFSFPETQRATKGEVSRDQTYICSTGNRNTGV